MNVAKRAIAAAQLLLVFPAALFMASLVVRRLQPLQYEPAHTAARIIMWYSGKHWTLWLLLMALPLTVLIIGGTTLLRSWADQSELRRDTAQMIVGFRAHATTLVVTAATLASGCILAIVALHMLAN